MFLHGGKIRSGTLGHGLHVRVDKATDLQICFFQDGISKCSHQTHGQLGLKEYDSSDHAELWVESLVHEQLNSHLLYLITKMMYVINKTGFHCILINNGRKRKM